MKKFLSAALISLALSFSLAAMAQEAVNINDASVESLMTLPGIGKVKAQAIVDDRETNGAYASLDDLTRVDGIGAATVTNLGDAATL